jgi:hypothetical protein
MEKSRKRVGRFRPSAAVYCCDWFWWNSGRLFSLAWFYFSIQRKGCHIWHNEMVQGWLLLSRRGRHHVIDLQWPAHPHESRPFFQCIHSKIRSPSGASSPTMFPHSVRNWRHRLLKECLSLWLRKLTHHFLAVDCTNGPFHSLSDGNNCCLWIPS